MVGEGPQTKNNTNDFSYLGFAQFLGKELNDRCQPLSLVNARPVIHRVIHQIGG
jgi:hypothetical protein